MSRKSSINKVRKNTSQSKDIQGAMMMDLYMKGYTPIVTNYTGKGLHECDVLAISKADLIYEFEVKISRSDFRKDFTKEHKHRLLLERKGISKYDKYKNGKRLDEQVSWFNIPNYFSYLVPKDLISVEEVPEYAGLIYIYDDYKTIEWVKRPPKLHDHRADDSLIRSIVHNLTCKFIFGSSYMRYMQKQSELNKNIDLDFEDPEEILP